MKKLSLFLLTIAMMTGISQAQFDFKKATASELAKLGPYLAPGYSALMWNSASSPDVFGIQFGVFAAGSAFPEVANVPTPSFMPNNLGLFVSAGTLGFEAKLRILPTDYVNSLGFGLKYDVSTLLPLPPGIPLSLSGYFDYNKVKLGSDEKTGYIDGKATTFGVLVGTKVLIGGVYARVGYEMSSADIVYTPSIAGIPASATQTVPVESNGLRLAVGGNIMMFDFEVGTRDQFYYALGLSFGI